MTSQINTRIEYLTPTTYAILLFFYSNLMQPSLH